MVSLAMAVLMRAVVWLALATGSAGALPPAGAATLREQAVIYSSDDVQLAGLLHLPTGGPHSAAANVAAVARAGDAAPTMQRSAPAAAEIAADTIDATIERWMAEDSIPGAAFVMVRDGRVVLSKGYGVADVESGRPVSPDATIFRVGSVTKALTAIATLRLIDEGRLGFNDPVRRHVGSSIDLQRYEEEVRVEDLLAHTGGFDQIGGEQRFASSPEERASLETFLAEELVQVRAPGTVPTYDTYGMTLLGHVIEKSTGRDYAEAMEALVFQPLAMTHSSVEAAGGERASLATGYGLEDGTPQPQEYEFYVTRPASSIDASAADMGKLLQALLAPRSDFLSGAMRSRLGTPQREYPGGVRAFSYGFWEDEWQGRRILHHGGVMRGYSSDLVLMPEIGFGYFIAYNRDPETGPTPRLRDELRATILGALYPPADAADTPEPVALQIDTRPYAGPYGSLVGCFSCDIGEGWGVSTFRLQAPEAGILQSSRRWRMVKPDVMEAEDGNGRAAFLRDQEGRIRYLLVGPNAFARLDEPLLDEVLGEGWKDRPATSLEAMAYRAAERWAEAAEAYGEIAARRRDAGEAHFYAGFSLLNAGQAAEALPWFDNALGLNKWIGWSRYYRAAALAGAGRTGEALDELDRAVASGFNDPQLPASDPWWDSVRGQARFQEIVVRIQS